MTAHYCDVLVVGAGAAGMTCAITAKHLGLNVLLVEKEDRIGGTTARSGGWLWGAGFGSCTGDRHPGGAWSRA